MITDSNESNSTPTQHSRRCTCPDCGSHAIERSEDVLAEIHNNSEVLESSGSPQVPGKYCTEDHCDWFKLNRVESETRDPPESSQQSPLAEDNGKIKLGNGTAVSIFHSNVTLLGDKAIYRAENHCPECASDVNIKLKRVTNTETDNTAQTEDEADEAYHPIGEECVNYGLIGNSCSYKRD